ncbi:BON domain-containing protein [Chlorogloeopsis fritschii PCC 9212]|uniref:BON domain-containing protein n=1 Tax=Chlorogloeopsis fritschii TaxID=1124 RepID=UPI0003710BD5|nr:BON domain-containing protein [Chlorogloeopsis fritschii]MBF2007528.1 BON domain-containing protein [Chlorogloeopsis fritschii C42_A2020_084]
MKRLIPLLISSVLVVGVAACETNSRTSTEAPSNVNENVNAPTKDTAQQTQQDAVSDTRKAQIESDIRAREQRNNITGGDADRADADLESEVRGKLEANLPASQLTVDAEEGVVTIAGTVPTQEQLNRVPTLAQEIKGVKNVDVKNVKVAPATPTPNQPQ